MELSPLELVRQHTRAAHAELEQRMHTDRIMTGTLEVGHLVRLLQVNHHFLEAVERNAIRHAELKPFVVTRAPLALEDLTVMGASPLPTTDELDSWDADHLRGALYVALGSLLGGAVIASKLKDMSGLPPVRQFFTADREALGIWRDFLAELNTVVGEPARDALVRGAQRTFAIAAEACTAAETSERMPA